MRKSETFYIRDYIFRETVSCPLKLSFLLQEGFNEQREDLFRRKTKRMLREAIVQQYGSVQYTSDRTEEAAAETTLWLKNDHVTICGAVVTFGNVRARIPILIKEDNDITLIQVHGKKVKRESPALFDSKPLGKSLNRYLLMAAFRSHVFQLAYPNFKIRCRFIFPLKAYHAEIDQLYQKTQGVRGIDEEALEELRKLFVTIDGTKAVRKVRKKIPKEVSHATFSDKTVPDAVIKIQQMHQTEITANVQSVHETCRNCTFRRSNKPGVPGCWDLYFPDDEVSNGDKHQFELIGHHVNTADLQQKMYQEKIPKTGNMSTADEVMNLTDKKIAIYHRKAMQLLEARDQKLPLVFAKAMLGKLKTIEYPVHFLDFEAASHAVPFQQGKRAYDPVFFQFSCHTLNKDGKLLHTQWLDQYPDSRIHHDLVASLAEIPSYSKGTVVQFSPFERQVLNKLHNEMKIDRSNNSTEVNFLEQFLHINNMNSGRRFLDLSVMLRDGYYNRYMNSGLSLKQILFAVLKVESILGTLNKTQFKVEDITIDLLKKDNQGRILDPYQQVSDDRSRIQDGITAMHAYLCLKAGVLSKEQTKLVPTLMKRYCTMDTLGLYLIFSHLINVMNSNNSMGDIVIG